MGAKVARLAMPLREPRRGDFRLSDDET